MSELVECCVHNLTESSGEAIDRTDGVRMSYCLDRCGTCYESSFLVIGGQPVTGHSYEEILSTADEPE